MAYPLAFSCCFANGDFSRINAHNFKQYLSSRNVAQVELLVVNICADIRADIGEITDISVQLSEPQRISAGTHGYPCRIVRVVAHTLAIISSSSDIRTILNGHPCKNTSLDSRMRDVNC